MSISDRRSTIPTSAVPSERVIAPQTEADLETSYRWLIPVWVLVAVFATVAELRSRHVGIPIKDPHGELFVSRVAISLGLFVAFALMDAAVRAGRPGWSPARVLVVLRERWTRRRLVLAMGGLLAYHLVYLCYHNLKSWDVFNRLRDDTLLRWDRWLFFGHNPAVLLHDLLGTHLADYVLMGIYESFSWLVSISFVAALVFNKRMRDGYVFIASAQCVWILGVASYYLIPSTGPFHADPQAFAGLPHTMIQSTQSRYYAQRVYMLAHPHASNAFAQISAFASLHVGVTFVILLMARYYGLRRLSWLLTAFLIGVMVATIYLGWHYAVDDLAGLVIGGLAVFLGRLMIYPHGRTPQPEAVQALPV